MDLDLVEIDGSYLEGGGQALRNALSLSCILGKPVRIVKIRANRPKPGLSHQHLHGVNLLKDITQAHVTGNKLSSTELEFRPQTIQADMYKVDTRTAASITLVYQVALPVLLFGAKSSRVDAIGGTNVAFAPQVEFMQEVLKPNLKRFGVQFDLKLLQYGFYPRGNGRCQLDIEPVQVLNAMECVNFGRLATVDGVAFCSGRVPMSVVFDMQQTAQREVHRVWPDQMCQIEVVKHSQDKARENGAGILMKAETSTGCVLGVANLGEKSIDGHVLGSDTSCQMSRYIQNEICVDMYMQDQIILYMALAKGCSRFRTGVLTKHTRTAIHVAEQMTGVKFGVEYESGGLTLVTCEGLGHRNAHF